MRIYAIRLNRQWKKAIKGMLIYNNVEPQFTHDIGFLLEKIYLDT